MDFSQTIQWILSLDYNFSIFLYSIGVDTRQGVFLWSLSAMSLLTDCLAKELTPVVLLHDILWGLKSMAPLPNEMVDSAKTDQKSYEYYPQVWIFMWHGVARNRTNCEITKTCNSVSKFDDSRLSTTLNSCKLLLTKMIMIVCRFRLNCQHFGHLQKTREPCTLFL